MSIATAIRKITISMPDDLVYFADKQAKASQTSRSQVISWLLAEAKTRTEAQLAAEGYQFYAQESIEFANATQGVVSFAWTDENWTDENSTATTESAIKTERLSHAG